jgi:hypothetical protein
MLGSAPTSGTVSPITHEANRFQATTRLKFIGQSPHAVLNISNDLLHYTVSLLRNEPSPVPLALEQEWSEWLSVTSEHGVQLLLYYKLRQLAPEFRPPLAITRQMAKAYLAGRLNCLRQEEQLQELSVAFRRANLEVLVLKGIAFAYGLYPDPALRPSSDIDLLVAPEEMNAGQTILQELGYQPLKNQFQDRLGLSSERVFTPPRPESQHLVELHFALCPFYWNTPAIGIEYLIHRTAREQKLSTLTIKSLDQVDQLIHAALHLTWNHSRDMRLLWIYDIALLAQKLRLPEDWKILQLKIVNWGAVLAVKFSLNLAQRWIGLSLLKGFEKFAKWPQPLPIENESWSRITQRSESLKSIFWLYYSPSWNLLDKARFLFRSVFPAPAYMKEFYPPSKDWLLFFSYLRRWWHWGKNSSR